MDEYSVEGGEGGLLPGIIGPRGVDGRAEWARMPEHHHAEAEDGVGFELLDALRLRMGSETDLHKVVLAVLGPLREPLEGAPLGALLARLPFPYAREVHEADLNLNASLHPPAGAADYYVQLAHLLQMQPATRALLAARAFFAAARSVLEPEESEAIAARLPDDLAREWSRAR